MKKHKLIKIAAVVMAAGMLAGCAAQSGTSQAERNGMFEALEGRGYDTYRIIVDKATGVMYWMSAGAHNAGTLTMLVNADGTPRIWEGWEE